VKLNDQDIYDICEFVIHNAELFIEAYVRYGSYLTLHDYILTRTATQLQPKYNSYDIQEAFDHPKLKAIVDFYIFEQDEDSEQVTKH
jgi:hypothetical protein